MPCACWAPSRTARSCRWPSARACSRTYRPRQPRQQSAQMLDDRDNRQFSALFAERAERRAAARADSLAEPLNVTKNCLRDTPWKRVLSERQGRSAGLPTDAREPATWTRRSHHRHSLPLLSACVNAEVASPSSTKPGPSMLDDGSQDYDCYQDGVLCLVNVAVGVSIESRDRAERQAGRDQQRQHVVAGPARANRKAVSGDVCRR